MAWLAQNVILKYFYLPQTAQLWNLLSIVIQESKTLTVFVIRLKKYYDIIFSPNLTHLYGEDRKFTAIHRILRMSHSPLNSCRCHRKYACKKTKNA